MIFAESVLVLLRDTDKEWITQQPIGNKKRFHVTFFNKILNKITCA